MRKLERRRELAELLFFPALLAYGEAAVAYGAEARRPGLAGRLAIWGVRVGWLAHTGLLAFQAVRAEGFPWSSWAGALNLLAWLVVGAYLIWGCRPRFRLLGLGVMPVAVGLLALAYAGGGIAAAQTGRPGALLAAHIALILAGLAGFVLAGGLSAFYLWHERRLKRRSSAILRLRVPPLDSLDRLAGRTVAASLAALTAGVLAGAVSFAAHGGSFDLAMAWTLVVWGLYAAYVVLRLRAGLHGRRAARLALVGLAGVAALLPITHFA
jgi:ABC-type transport system involved in cytochrome c biogenesis permease subunit